MKLPLPKPLRLPSSEPLERDVQRKVIAHAKQLGAYARKFSSPANAAVPDYIVLHRGRALFIEFKRRGKRPTPNQEDELRQIREQAFLIFVIDDVPVGKFILELVLL